MPSLTLDNLLATHELVLKLLPPPTSLLPTLFWLHLSLPPVLSRGVWVVKFLFVRGNDGSTSSNVHGLALPPCKYKCHFGTYVVCKYVTTKVQCTGVRWCAPPAQRMCRHSFLSVRRNLGLKREECGSSVSVYLCVCISVVIMVICDVKKD